ncbi:FAD:protein FMN transferase [Rhodospirillum centenum]|uniref:FAD:protein FMN transferase n=1 Tax=Rhodospirillum centenum (strain ATCC 51521 / SW) TaxID=414684 RepID=B6IY75_RHOCS|nr:FAD:protein FMN transferase [Rhodospirillum centenum]ACJ01249.1 NosX protein [Rhodospirillum centenum SW]
MEGIDRSRRRFLGLTAAVAGLALLPSAAAARAGLLHGWRGTALGADACLRLVHPDAAEARRLIGLCLAEVARLERVFSLHRADSALVRLNRDGRLDDAPADLVRLMAEAAAFARASGGRFDMTVQPLWALHAGHFAQAGADPAGPAPARIEAVRRLVGFQAVEIGAGRIAFARPGMQATLNGIAQGYITDRIVELLRQEGLDDVLVDMGEIRAQGRRPDGRPWQVGLDDAGANGPLALTGAAVATSAATGTVFDMAGRFGHLIDPATGRPGALWRTVSVGAPTATTADALSTALSGMPGEAAAALLSRYPGTTAFLTGADGRTTVLGMAAGG